MKKIFLTIATFLFIGAAAYASIATDTSGSILLQVEENGEAWYVYPSDLQRYYLGRPTDAFDIMRSLGLGIAHEELGGYLNSTFPSRLSGLIVLDVEANGEAYYVYPKDLKGYYLGRPADAFDVMRNLGLGISNSDLSQITLSEASVTPIVESSSPNCNGKDAPLQPFLDDINVWCDDTYMYVESSGLSDDQMMVGITAWNQQMPLPHPISGNNAWRIPLNPVYSNTTTATNPMGVNGMMVNGVGFFNPNALPQGEYRPENDVVLRGELDVCGGHAGQGDDYHYHAAPTCVLNEQNDYSSGRLPVGYALDGYPIYAFVNPDSSTPVLDECNGQYDEEGNYHYHLTHDYPYVLGCFRGVVDFNLQIQQHGIRAAGTPIAVDITEYTYNPDGWSRLTYIYNGREQQMSFRTVDSDCYEFEYVDTSSRTMTYCSGGSQSQPGGGQVNYAEGQL